MPHVTVQVQLGTYAFQGRAVESLDIRQAVGEHAECTLVFDRDPRATASETREVAAAALADARLQIVLAKSDDAPPDPSGGRAPSAGATAVANVGRSLLVEEAGGAGVLTAAVGAGRRSRRERAQVLDAVATAAGFLAFDGRVREVKVEHRADGTARFTVRAFSASYELGAHAEQRYFPKQTIAGLAGALDVAVAGAVPATAPRDYWQRGESRWAFYARAAAVEGLQLRATWGRRPGERASHPAEVAQGFAPETHVVTWGRDLTEFAVVARPTNHGVTGAFTDPATKHTHQFRGVRKSPRWLGGARPLAAALEQVATEDAGGGDPGHVDVGGLGGTRARTLEEFRTRLERASEARLGGAIEATGTSTEPALRAGDLLEVRDASAGGAAASWNVGAEERQGTYGLVRVEHHWRAGLYQNTFAATPWAGYHPAPKAVEQSLRHAAAALGGADASGTEHGFGTPTTDGGVTLATVFDDDDPKKLGRVRVQFAHQQGSEASHWLRVAGPGGGKGHGAGHVPLKGNLVAVTPVKHDDEHPLVIGAVYDQTDAGGHTKDRIQTITRSGSGLSLNTGQGGATDHVELHTPGGQAMVRLNGSLVTIHAEGDISIEAPNGEVRIHARSMTTTVDTTVVREVTGDVHDSVQGSVTRAVKGDTDDTVQGSATRKVVGDVHETVQGSVMRAVASNVDETVRGSATRKVTGDVRDTVQGSVVHAVAGNVIDTIQGAAKRDVTGDSSTTAANVTVSARGTMDATAGAVHTIKGGQVKIN